MYFRCDWSVRKLYRSIEIRQPRSTLRDNTDHTSHPPPILIMPEGRRGRKGGGHLVRISIIPLPPLPTPPTLDRTCPAQDLDRTYPTHVPTFCGENQTLSSFVVDVVDFQSIPVHRNMPLSIHNSPPRPLSGNSPAVDISVWTQTAPQYNVITRASLVSRTTLDST